MNVTNGVYEITVLVHAAAEEKKEMYREFLEHEQKQCEYWAYRVQKLRTELMLAGLELRKHQKSRDDLKRMVQA